MNRRGVPPRPWHVAAGGAEGSGAGGPQAAGITLANWRWKVARLFAQHLPTLYGSQRAASADELYAAHLALLRSLAEVAASECTSRGVTPE